MSGELPEERWLPSQTVGTVLLSVISMLNDPNTSSPANVDASVRNIIINSKIKSEKFVFLTFLVLLKQKGYVEE